jgi:hypothetical protein
MARQFAGLAKSIEVHQGSQWGWQWGWQRTAGSRRVKHTLCPGSEDLFLRCVPFFSLTLKRRLAFMAREASGA